MSSSRVLARSARVVLGAADVCGVCRVRQTLLPLSRSNAFLPSAQAAASVPRAFRRNYAQKLDVKRLRADVDRKNRMGFYQLSRREKILLLEPDVAEAMYNEFVNRKDKANLSSCVKTLLTRYNTDLNSISGLAIMTFQIPDLTDSRKRAMLPPSPHKTNAAQLLQGCAQLGDPLAVKHIVTADYLATSTKNAPALARDLASHFPRKDIGRFRNQLNELKLEDGKTDDPEALTLIGLISEADNHPIAARGFYEKALQVPWVYDYSVHKRHPAQLPITPPWIALGALLAGGREAERALARPVLEKGAKQGDDPLACYIAKKLAKEWYGTAGKAGQLEAWEELAEWFEEEGGEGDERARQVRERIVEWGESVDGEFEFGEVVKRAKGRLRTSG
ncbi:hypothetical protein E8E13_000439 [Curvularia kusanoi]|uniref:Uncharacterized protein n=1 Tax=Curvularia kusanoi TaxID=90978 RepID=A0A9P4T3E2_CURKU|nr:hypothetical protein E8E13_000439 [Curvularia kusanoi]